MYVKCFSSALMGIDAITITVEVNVSSGVHLNIVGLPDNAVKESQQRISSAFQNSGYKLPGKRITVNMAPANVKKEGSYFDLPIAIAILACTGQIECEQISNYMIMGELSLDGRILPIKGALPIAMHAAKEHFKSFILPEENAAEASVVQDLDVYGVKTLLQVAMFLNGKHKLDKSIAPSFQYVDDIHYLEDFADVKGQETTKRALEIAAAGGHNLLMIGPPGGGKTMIARRIPTILPPLTIEESLETTKIYSVAGKKIDDNGLIRQRPFRSPHHTLSNVALVGGGTYPKPGEVSLSHNGVLFCDELPEFGRSVLEVLRQPLEDKLISISRSQYSVEFPANFMFVASMNPCPCGYLTHPEKDCTCKRGDIIRYLNRVSGPLLDRIDIHIEVLPVSYDKLSNKTGSENSCDIRKRVCDARNIQNKRFLKYKIHSNAMMGSRHIEKFCSLDQKCSDMLKSVMERMGFSARAYTRILKLSRTIADLDCAENIQFKHLAEAVQYRALDRKDWIM